MHQSAYIEIFDIGGTRVAEFANWNYIEVHHQVNDFSTHTLSMPLRHPDVVHFTKDCIVRLNRKVGETWMVEYEGFHRTPRKELTEGGHRIFTSYGRGFLDLLNRRSILYTGTTSYTLKNAVGETVMKAWVNENCGPSATKPPRIRDGVFPGFTVEASAGRGTAWFGQRSLKNLLEVIREVASKTHVDFDVVRIGGANFEFRCYHPQRGVDRSGTLTFSAENGNALAPSFTLSATEQTTVAVVAGPGQGSARRILVREDLVESAATPWNDIEVIVDASSEVKLGDMQNAGDLALRKGAVGNQFSFKVVQTNIARYGRDYVVGDVVGFAFGDYSTTQQIYTARVNISEGKTDIDIGFRNEAIE